jgi:hypothetical protein
MNCVVAGRNISEASESELESAAVLRTGANGTALVLIPT